MQGSEMQVVSGSAMGKGMETMPVRTGVFLRGFVLFHGTPGIPRMGRIGNDFGDFELLVLGFHEFLLDRLGTSFRHAWIELGTDSDNVFVIGTKDDGLAMLDQKVLPQESEDVLSTTGSSVAQKAEHNHAGLARDPPTISACQSDL